MSIILKTETIKKEWTDYNKHMNVACYNADLVIIHTEWDEFKTIDFKKIYRNKNLKLMT